ncbi:hypothetical protein I7I50_12495 [Histoplasma capsulatum G186AR]|uniref:Uncharacterized protein n=1 Tax=Ajellomyces capsulatus TaxID=5037 RepID=A0A8H7YD23_AJECA|nr:hypothetical protein I7I52_11197 [Histoplasma capsulatum]QSS70760.1 hypothetical protein I7I50_12495 [Histoplasma capsulatum G186AR]
MAQPTFPRYICIFMEFTGTFFTLLLRFQFYHPVGRNNISALLISSANEEYHNPWHDDFSSLFLPSLPPSPSFIFFYFFADDSIKSQVKMIDATWSPYATEHSRI